jgi:hypothetical protein
MSIQCPKCKSMNPSSEEKCQSCGTDLLQGYGRANRIVAIVCLAIIWLATILCGCLGFLNQNPLIGYTSIAVGIALVPFTLWAARKGPAQYILYENRAKRHMKIDPKQAYQDFTRAFRLVPWSRTALRGRSLLSDKVDLSIDDLCEEIGSLTDGLDTSSRRNALKHDAREILAREVIELSIRRINREGELGLANEVLSHQVQLLDFIEANVEDIHQFKTDTIGFGTGITMHLRGELRKNIQKTRTELYRRGLVKAMGYCRRCKEDVEPDLDLDCSRSKSHGKLDRVRLFVPDTPSQSLGG